MEETVGYLNIFELAPRIKGVVEEAIIASGIPYRSFFRPAQFETEEFRFGAVSFCREESV